LTSRSAAERWRWRGTVALTAVALGFVIYPLIEGSNDVINSDWPAFATGGRLIVEDPGHLYDMDAQRRTQLEVTGGRSLVTLGINGILPFLAPAWAAFLAVPFDLLGTNVGGRLWILAGLACLALLRKRYPKVNARDFDGDPKRITEADALIAYLQLLGTGVSLRGVEPQRVSGVARRCRGRSP